MIFLPYLRRALFFDNSALRYYILLNRASHSRAKTLPPLPCRLLLISQDSPRAFSSLCIWPSSLHSLTKFKISPSISAAFVSFHNFIPFAVDTVALAQVLFSDDSAHYSGTQYALYKPLNSSSTSSTFGTSQSPISLLFLPALSSCSFLSPTSKTSCLYPAEAFFLLTINFFIPPNLATCRLTALRHSRSSLFWAPRRPTCAFRPSATSGNSSAAHLSRRHTNPRRRIAATPSFSASVFREC